MKVYMQQWYGHCHRCGDESSSSNRSLLNGDLICVKCLLVEREHPNYSQLQQLEEEYNKRKKSE